MEHRRIGDKGSALESSRIPRRRDCAELCEHRQKQYRRRRKLAKIHPLQPESHCNIALLCMFFTQFKNLSRTYADALVVCWRWRAVMRRRCGAGAPLAISSCLQPRVTLRAGHVQVRTAAPSASFGSLCRLRPSTMVRSLISSSSKCQRAGLSLPSLIIYSSPLPPFLPTYPTASGGGFFAALRAANSTQNLPHLFGGREVSVDE